MEDLLARLVCGDGALGIFSGRGKAVVVVPEKVQREIHFD
jgi:hypothetical protein